MNLISTKQEHHNNANNFKKRSHINNFTKEALK